MSAITTTDRFEYDCTFDFDFSDMTMQVIDVAKKIVYLSSLKQKACAPLDQKSFHIVGKITGPQSKKEELLHLFFQKIPKVKAVFLNITTNEQLSSAHSALAFNVTANGVRVANELIAINCPQLGTVSAKESWFVNSKYEN